MAGCGSTHQRALRWPFAAAIPVAGALLALCALAPLAQAAPRHPAGGSDPVIVWDESMIVAGQNNGNPRGPVGEHARVQGQRFLDGQYKLALAKGDVNGDPTNGATVCAPANLTDLGVSVAVAGGTQTFDASFDWPAAANQVNAAYSICALKTSDSSLASHLDSGPFTVLAAQPPRIQISAATVAPGGAITVSGKNFVPPQAILVYAAPCQNCGAPKTASATVTSADLNAGTFTAMLTFPTGTQAGSYYVGAISQNGVLSVTEQTVTVTTPSPTATRQPSPTATTIPSVTPTQTGSGGTTSDTRDNTGLLVGFAIAILVLLAVLAGLVAYLFARRRTPPKGTPGAGGRPSGQPLSPAYGAAPPPLPMPDEAPTVAGSWDPAATRAADGAPADPASYDAPTDPGLGAARDPRR